MRILITTPWFPSPEAPIRGIWTLDHARALLPEHDVVMLPFAPSPQARAPFTLDDRTDDGLRVIRIAYPPPKLPGLGLISVGRGTSEVLQRLEAEGFVPDVIHAHVFLSAPAAFTARRRSGAPLLINEHLTRVTENMLSRGESALARYAYRRADLVCVLGQPMLEQVRRLGAREVLQTSNTLDSSQFWPARDRSADGAIRAIAVGSLNEKKGHRFLLEALGSARQAGHRLTLDIVGDGPLRVELEAQARALGLEDSVRFHGFVPHDGLGALMRAADLHVLPSLRENQPLVVAEALATGIPTVATAVGGVPEMLEPDAGVVVPPGDASALAEAIMAVCSRLDSFDREALATRAREQYGPKATARMWTEIYATLAKEDTT